jgi:hypothetical protein
VKLGLFLSHVSQELGGFFGSFFGVK